MNEIMDEKPQNYDFVIGHWSYYHQMVHLKDVSLVAVNVVVGFFFSSKCRLQFKNELVNNSRAC